MFTKNRQDIIQKELLIIVNFFIINNDNIPESIKGAIADRNT